MLLAVLCCWRAPYGVRAPYDMTCVFNTLLLLPSMDSVRRCSSHLMRVRAHYITTLHVRIMLSRKTVRKTLSPCFSMDAVRRCFPSTQRIAQQLAAMWAALPQVAAAKQDQPDQRASVAIEDFIRRASFDMIGVAGRWERRQCMGRGGMHACAHPQAAPCSIWFACACMQFVSR
jgi:hypothetical protein